MDKSIDERGGDCGSGQEQLEEGYNSQRLQDTALNDDETIKQGVTVIEFGGNESMYNACCSIIC